MPRPLQVPLTAVERAALVGARDPHANPSIRERAAALVRVADGPSARQAARRGGLTPRRVETVSRWVVAVRQQGVAGRLVAPGRGRTPAVSPAAPRRRGCPRRAG
jgi:transposase